MSRPAAALGSLAERWEDTDWEQIVLLYDMLLPCGSSPGF
jgi:predicted RNA polymerase sigma factor